MNEKEIRFEQVKTEQYICIKDELEGMWWWEFENLTVPVNFVFFLGGTPHFFSLSTEREIYFEL